MEGISVRTLSDLPAQTNCGVYKDIRSLGSNCSDDNDRTTTTVLQVKFQYFISLFFGVYFKFQYVISLFLDCILSFSIFYQFIFGVYFTIKNFSFYFWSFVIG